ncbi:MAG: PilZ domain-containing protein [Pseudomonadota bacterium]
MLSAAERQKRDYFRVRCEAVVAVSPVAPDMEQAAIRQFQAGVGSEHPLIARLAAATRESDVVLQRIAAQYPDVAAYLRTLDNKIELLANLATQIDTAVPDGEPMTVDLSASGIGFETETRFDRGALVRLRMVLLPSYTALEVLARVVRTATRPSVSDKVAFAFEHITDRAREALIQHVLDRQAQRLRSRGRVAQGRRRH